MSEDTSGGGASRPDDRDQAKHMEPKDLTSGAADAAATTQQKVSEVVARSDRQSAADALTLPDQVTEPLAEYVAAVHEFVNMILHQYDMAELLDGLLDVFSAPDSSVPVERPMNFKKATSSYRPLYSQIFINKTVDYYPVYVAKLLTLVFIHKPETLRSGAQIRIDYALERETMKN